MHRIVTKNILIAMLLTIVLATSYGQQEWKLVKAKNGIKVYKPIIAETDYSTFKAVVNINSSVHSFVALLLDIENFSDWGHGVKHVDLLVRKGDTLQIYYSIGKAPFPFDNRDGVYLNRFNWMPDSNLLLVDIEILQDYLETKEKLVRITGDGMWKVKSIDANNIEITFQMSINPGGNIPSWLSTMFIEVTPYNTLYNLRKAILKSRYQNVFFDFIEQ